jgi:hypothetical protein
MSYSGFDPPDLSFPSCRISQLELVPVLLSGLPGLIFLGVFAFAGLVRSELVCRRRTKLLLLLFIFCSSSHLAQQFFYSVGLVNRCERRLTSACFPTVNLTVFRVAHRRPHPEFRLCCSLVDFPRRLSLRSSFPVHAAQENTARALSFLCWDFVPCSRKRRYRRTIFLLPFSPLGSLQFCCLALIPAHRFLIFLVPRSSPSYFIFVAAALVLGEPSRRSDLFVVLSFSWPSAAAFLVFIKCSTNCL